MTQSVMMERAELFHRVVNGAGLFREPMRLDEFKAAVSGVVEKYTEHSQKNRSRVDSMFIVGLPVALKTEVQDKLKLSEEALRPIFTERAMAFHRAMMAAKAYTMPVEETTFLEIASPIIHGSIRSALDMERGILDMAVLYLPSQLVGRLRDKVLYYSWDFEFGYEAYFSGLERVLGQTDIDLEWDLVEEGDEKWVQFQIGSRGWTTDVSRTGFGHIMSEQFFGQLKEIDQYFETLGWQNIGLPGVDQVAESILVPLENAHILEEWLLRIFYGPRYGV